jgi:hypothetical protein
MRRNIARRRESSPRNPDDEETTMRTNFRHAICKTGTALTLIMVSGALNVAAAQTIITTEPAQTRTIVREPLTLTPAQRTTIYRTIIPQGRGKQPIVKEREVRETVGRRAPVSERVVTEPAMRERVISEPVVRERVVVDPPLRERVVTRPSEVEYVVGDRVPATVELAAFPDTVIRDVPAARGYRYMIVNDRLLLVDPMTSTVVEEIVR